MKNSVATAGAANPPTLANTEIKHMSLQYLHTADEPVVTTNQWHAKHKVNCLPLEFLVWQWQVLQEASWQGIDILNAL